MPNPLLSGCIRRGTGTHPFLLTVIAARYLSAPLRWTRWAGRTKDPICYSSSLRDRTPGRDCQARIQYSLLFVIILFSNLNFQRRSNSYSWLNRHLPNLVCEHADLAAFLASRKLPFKALPIQNAQPGRDWQSALDFRNGNYQSPNEIRDGWADFYCRQTSETQAGNRTNAARSTDNPFWIRAQGLFCASLCSRLNFPFLSHYFQAK